MPAQNDASLMKSAAQKMTVGGLMTLGEVAAMLGVTPQTVHGLPLPSIRLGHSLRFDPRQVEQMITDCTEPVVR